MDRYDLTRFVTAQEHCYAQACAELAAGEKRSHWMWFIFPQLRGLGRSATAQHYALEDLSEARAYLAHPLLGPRLRECTALTLAAQRPPERLFGYPDHLKYHSSMTLFARAGGDSDPFRGALAQYFGGAEDAATLRLLRAAEPPDDR